MRRGFQEFFGFLGGAHSYFDDQGILRGDQPAGTVDYTTDDFAIEAVAFIEKNRKESWFLYLAFNAVHTPMHATEERLKKFESITEHKLSKYASLSFAMEDAM